MTERMDDLTKPDVQGGQGRTSRSILDSTWIFGAAIAIAIILMAIAWAYNPYQ